jgi:hypothetical protein
MPVTQNAAAVADRWASRMAGSSEKIKAGIASVTVSPTAKAADAGQRWVDGVMRAFQSGKYANNLRAVTLDQWKSAATNKGIPRIAMGVNEAKPKFQNFMQKFLPHVAAGVQSLESMPRGDLNQNIERMVAMVRHNANFRA